MDEKVVKFVPKKKRKRPRVSADTRKRIGTALRNIRDIEIYGHAREVDFESLTEQVAEGEVKSPLVIDGGDAEFQNPDWTIKVPKN